MSEPSHANRSPALIAHEDIGARTHAIQEAIDGAHEDGGGRVTIPKGRWRIRTLTLRSGVELHLAAGAVLEPDDDLDSYPQHARGHNKDRQPYHLLYAHDAEDIALTGPGMIDGRGMSFWDPPPAGSPYYKSRGRRISPLVDFQHCRRVLVRDVTLHDSPGWTLHTFNCDHVRIEGVAVQNHLYGPNTDGFDINGCRHVMVSNCRLHGCDDNIIIKATADARACEHVTVTNCVLESNCAALGLGAETISGIRYVTFNNCAVINAIRMLQIIIWDGGTVEHVTVNNITGRALTAVGTDRVIHFDVQEHKGESPTLGLIRHVRVSNVTAETRGRILLTAQEGSLLDDIAVQGVSLVYPEIEDPAQAIPRSGSQQLSNFNPEARVARAAVVVENARRLVLRDITTSWPAEPEVPLHGLWAKNAHGIVDTPMLTASTADTPTCALTACDLRNGKGEAVG